MDPVRWLENVAEGSPVLLLLIVMLALFVDSLAVLGALLPGDLLLLIPSAAVGLPGSPIVVLGGVLGTILGYTVSYGVGRRAGPAIRGSRIGRWVGEHRWDQAERMLRGPTGRTLALVQFMPVLNYLVPLLAGTLKVPLKRFVQLTSIGAVAYCSCCVFLGVLAGGTGAAIGESAGRLAGLVVVAAAAAVLGGTVLARTLRRTADSAPRDARDGAGPPGAGPPGAGPPGAGPPGAGPPGAGPPGAGPPGAWHGADGVQKWTQNRPTWHTAPRVQPPPLFLRVPDPGARGGVTHSADQHDAPESTDPGRRCCRGT